MMKRNCTVLSVTIIVLLMGSMVFAEKKGADKTYRGRIIHLTEEYVELKWGAGELVFYFTENTRFLSSSGAEKDRGILRLCQVVRAYYRIENGKKVLYRIKVLREGNCRG